MDRTDQVDRAIRILLMIQSQTQMALDFLCDEIADGGECRHPPERRVDMTTMAGPERWSCMDCGYEYEEDD